MHRLVFFMNINTKAFNEILGNKIQQFIKTILHCDQVRFSSYMQHWPNIQKSINVISRLKKENHTIVSFDAEKEFDRFNTYS